MLFVDATLKGRIIMTWLARLVRMSYMHFTGYEEGDFTYWSAIVTWNVAGVVAIVIYEIAARMIESGRSTQIPVEMSTRQDTTELV
jgi:hypothetical protein